MKEIDIKSIKYPGTVVQVSDEDYEAVSSMRWYVSVSKNGTRKITSSSRQIKNGKVVSNETTQLMHFIHKRRMGYKVHGQLMQKNGKDYDFRRSNVVKLKEEIVVKNLIINEKKEGIYNNKQNGNDFCAGLAANMKLRAEW